MNGAYVFLVFFTLCFVGFICFVIGSLWSFGLCEKPKGVLGRKGKIGEIIYPEYNGTNGWFQKPRWDLVMKVNRDEEIISIRHLWSVYELRAVEAIQDLMEIKKK